MQNEDIIEFNKNGWNELIKSNTLFSNTSLPEYGPFMSSEENLQLFKDVNNKIVLELGSGSGQSLKYLSTKGAKEIWGIDISHEQIERAKKLNIKNSKFILSAMEENNKIPTNYFDYVFSLYSIGYSSDPLKVFELASSYLKRNGKFILCWTHPFFNCLDIKDDILTIKHSYNDESAKIIKKGEKGIEFIQYNLKISTLINGLISSGMEIEQIIEESPQVENNIGYISSYWDEKKLNVSPTTLIIVAKKK